MDVQFKISGQGERAVATVVGNGVFLATPQDMLDLVATVHYQYDATRLVVQKENIAEAFFDLKTGLAGEMLQKVINYHAAVAIVGDFSAYTSKALRDFIYESNQGRRIFFVPDEQEALKRLSEDADV